MKKKIFKNEKIRITDSFIGHGGSKIGSNKRKFEQLKVRITEGFLVELVKEYPRGMKNGSNKREVRKGAGSKNREFTVLSFYLPTGSIFSMHLPTEQIHAFFYK